MEQYHDFRMADDCSINEQAHEFQLIVRELEQLGHVLPDKFVAGGFIAKLPSSWTNFATALKHKRQQISFEDLLAGLDVEEKAQAKDAPKAPEGQSSANMMHHAGKKNYKPNQNTQFKKKINMDEVVCFVCGENGHFAKYKNHKGKKNEPGQKYANVTIGNPSGSRYNNLLYIFFVCQSNDLWIDTGANIHVCTDITMFSSDQVRRGSTVMMGNDSHATVVGVDTVDLKFTSRKIVRLKNMQHVPSINKNLVSGSILCRDGFKLVFESNKVVMLWYIQFIGNGYDSGGLFRFSLSDFCNKVVNHVCDSNNFVADIWHSDMCHINFVVCHTLILFVCHVYRV
jgi:hypothetical protein